MKKLDEGTFSGTPDEVHAAVREVLAQKIDKQLLCMRMAYDAIIAFVSGDYIREDGMVSLSAVPAFTAIEKHLGRPLTDDEAGLIGWGMADVFSHGFSPCDVWEIGHQLEHIFYDRETAPPKSVQN